MASALLARARARAGVLGGVAAVVLVLAGLGTAIVDAAAGSAVTGMQAGAAQAGGADGAMRWQIRRSTDPEAQTRAGAAVLDRTLPAATSDWSRSTETAPIAGSVDGAGLDAELVLLADPGAADRSRLVDGAWPDDPEALAQAAGADAAPAAVHAGAAAVLGLAPGALVELDGRRLLIVGVWEPEDARDPAWFGEPLVATGLADDAAGPLLVAEEAMDALPVAVRVRWTATAVADALDPEAARELSAALAEVPARLAAEPGIGQDGLTTLGGLQAELSTLLAGLDAVRAVTPLPLLLLAAAGVAALARLGSLLAGARRGETVLLRARGASAGRLALWQSIETAAVAVPAAAAGAVGGELAVVIARPGEPRSWAIAATVAAVAALGAVVLLSASAWREARRPVTRGAADDSGRMSRAAALGGTVLVVLGAVLSFWQFRLYGSPLVRSADGGTAVDPVAVLAPVLLVLALCLGALALTPSAARLLERSAASRPGLVPALPMRQLARRTPMFAAVAFTAMLGVAGLVLASAVAGSWRDFDAAASAVATGGEVRVVAASDPGAATAEIERMPRVGAVAPVVRRDARVGPETATLIAAPTAELPEVAPGSPADVAPVLPRLAESGGLLPVAVDAVLAEQVHTGVGQRIAVRLGTAEYSVDAEVVAVLDAVPGAGAPALLADLDRLNEAVAAAGEPPLAADELWLEASDPVAVAAAIDEARPGGAIALPRTVASSALLVSPAVTALWTGAAGALVLAIATLLALIAALGEARAGEVLVLRALGTPAATQARARFAELAAVVAIAIVLGAGIGVVAGALTAGELARAAVPAAPAALPSVLALDWLPLGLALLGFALVCGVIAAAAAREVGRRAARPGREEVR